MMIEKTILEYLDGALDSLVYMETPGEPPERYYLVEKTSASVTDGLWAATIIVQAIAPTLYGAAVMAEDANVAMLEAPRAVSVIPSVVLNSSYNFTDTSRKEYRYQSVFNLLSYEG